VGEYSELVKPPASFYAKLGGYKTVNNDFYEQKMPVKNQHMKIHLQDFS
jgi:hypothetical protein